MAKNNKEQIILNALLAYPTVREASAATCVPESPIYLKLKDQQFLEQYNSAKVSMLHSTTTFLQAKLSEATATIIELMSDTATPPQVRLSAARSVFEFCIKLTEQSEVIKRIEALEGISNDS